MKRRESVTCLSSLPEGCLAEILSRTTPRDVCRLAATSSAFNAAARADLVWNTFLPSDVDDIIVPVDSHLSSLSRRNLFFSLCRSPLTLQDSLRFSLDKESGKKCYMIPSTMLVNAVDKTPKEWKWTPSNISGIKSVLKFSRGSRIGLIQGKFRASSLSSRTRYCAYLIFKLLEKSVDYYPVSVSVNYVKTGKNEVKVSENRAYLTAETPVVVPMPKCWNFSVLREDGWMEVMMGEFYNDDEDDGEAEVELVLKSFKALVCTLHVQGIELRPADSEGDGDGDV